MHKLSTVTFLTIFSLALSFSSPAVCFDKNKTKDNFVSAAALLNNKATNLLMQGKYDQAIPLYRSLLADYPNYKMGYANLGIALFNKAADLQDKNKDWVMLDLLEEAVFWNPQDKKAVNGLNAQIDCLNLNPKSRSDRLDLAERAKQRGNKRAALTELRAARSIQASKDLEKEINELEASLTSEHVVHFATKDNLQDIDCRPYMENVQSRIKSAWDAPFSERSLSAATIFSIDLNGKIKNIKIDKPSPRKDYNAAAIKALNTVEWMRELPLGLKVDIDIQFTFDYNVYSKTHREPPRPNPADINFAKILNQAKAFYRLKNFTSAIDKYKEALKLNVEDGRTLAENHMSDSYYQLAKQTLTSNAKEAAENFRQCLILAPDYDRAEAGLSSALEKIGVNPKSVTDREKLIDEMVANHNYDFALVDCKSLLKISNKEEKERFTDKLIQIQRVSRSARAKNNWEEFLKKNPNSIEAKIAMAQCFIDMNEKPQAIEQLNDVLKQNPHHKQAKDLLDKLNSN